MKKKHNGRYYSLLMKKFFEVVLVLSMLLGCIPCIAGAEIVKSGNCGANGDNVTWTLDDNGTLTISGTGKMEKYYRTDYGYCNSPFYENSDIKSVVIENGVTSIGEYTFYNNNSISITIPASITSIGDGNSCDSLYISDLAAYLNMEGVSPISGKLYLNNKRVTGNIVIPDGVTSIVSYAFGGCNGITSITIPASVQAIGESAFRGCSRLKDVYISDLAAWCNIEFVGESSNYYHDIFYYSNPMCYADNLYINNELVTDLVIPDEVTQIRESAFYNCGSLDSVTIPDSVTTIDKYAFSNCDNLINVAIGNGVTNIGDNAFNGCDNLINVTVGSGVTSVGNDVFKDCRRLIKFNYNAKTVFPELFGNGKNGYNSNIASVTFGDNTESIKDKAFKGCKELRKIFIPESVIEIEDLAFSGCSNLLNIEYGGSQAAWEEMYIGTENENLTNAQINYNSSAENAALTDLDFLVYTKDENNTITITECSKVVTDINLPKKIDGLPVTTIGKSAFEECVNLKNITIPDSVTSIEYEAFSHCSDLTSVIISDSVTSIDDSAFSYCSSLKNITIPGSVIKINLNTFYNCEGLTNVIIENGVSEILSGAFSYCSSLTSITIPESVTKIRYRAFNECANLKDVYYSGTEAQWKSIDIDSDNNESLIKNATIHYNSIAPTPIPTPALKCFAVSENKVTNTSKNSQTATVITAEYNSGGILQNVSMKTLEFAANETKSFNVSGNYKIFVWDSVSGMHPLTK